MSVNTRWNHSLTIVSTTCHSSSMFGGYASKLYHDDFIATASCYPFPKIPGMLFTRVIYLLAQLLTL